MTQAGGSNPVMVYQNPPPRTGRIFFRVVFYLVLLVSLVLNGILIAALSGMAILTGGFTPGHVRQVVIRHGTPNKVAIIPISGLISSATVQQLRVDLRTIRHDAAIKALVLRVDSPGGGVTAADDCYHALRKLRGAKPLVVSMGALAASGAYYISMASQQIYAEPTTITGSIGVMMPGFQMTGLLDKIGVKPEFLTSKAAVWKEAGSPFSEFTPPVKAYLRHLLDVDDARFESIVQRGRGTRLKAPLAQVANGKIFTARAALRQGLVDHIGYLATACQAAAKLAKIAHPTIVELKAAPGLLSLLNVRSVLPAPRMQISRRLLLDLACPRMEYLYMP